MRRMTLVLVTALALVAIVPSVAEARLVARLYATTHHPKVGKKWPIRITARDGKKKVCGNVRYAFLFQGKVVAHRNAGVGGHFCGNFKDPNIIWPKRAVGIPLTFRAVVDTKIGQANLDYAVQVTR
jgi:hypothetical protein